MNSRSRSASALVLVILIIVGIVLVIETTLDPVFYGYDTERQVCYFQYTVHVNPNQSIQDNCAVLQGDWFNLAVISSSNLTVTIWLNLVNAGGRILLFNDSSSSLNASLPFTSSGAITSQLS